MVDTLPMDLIDGGDEPNAHMHRRIRPSCDLCGAPLKGPMPKPLWIAPSARALDENGHPEMEDSVVRVYLCGEHRKALEDAMHSAWRRERDRRLQGQRMFPDVSPVRPVR